MLSHGTITSFFRKDDENPVGGSARSGAKSTKKEDAPALLLEFLEKLPSLAYTPRAGVVG